MLKKLELFSLFLFTSLIFFYSKPLIANASGDDAKVVRVGYYENEIFQEGASEGAIKKGYAYEYYRKLAEYTGWKYEYVYGDFADLYQMLLKGEIDLLAGLAYTDDRAEIIAFPDEPMGTEAYGFVKNHDDIFITTDPHTLNGVKIGVLESAVENTLRDYLEKNHISAQVITYSNNNNMVAAFNRREIHVMAAEYDGTYERNHAELLFSFGSADYYLCANIKDESLIKDLNFAQYRMLSEEPDFIPNLRAKYYSSTLTSRAFTFSEKVWLEENHNLRIGYLNNYLPYSDTDKNGNPTGLVNDIIPEMLNELSIRSLNISYIGYDSYDDMIKAINDGTIDLAFPVGGGLFFAEEDGINLSNPVSSTTSNLIYSNENKRAVTTDFAVNKNNKMQYYFIKTYYPEYTIKEYPSIDACLDAVVKGEVKCTTLNGLRTNDLLRNVNYDNLSFGQTRYTDNRCFGVKIGNEGLLKIINRGVSIIGQEYIYNVSLVYSQQLYTSTIKDIIRRHFWNFLILILLFIVLILLLLIAQRIRNDKRLAKTQNAKDTFEIANSRKTVFLKNLTHDTRTGLNAIIGLMDLFYHSDNEKEKEHYLAGVNFLSEQILIYINDVIDLLRIEDGNTIFDEQKVNLHDIINGVRVLVAPAASEKGQILTFNYKNIKHTNIVADTTRLTQILMTVLTNSISFTESQGIIDVTVEELPSDDEKKCNYRFRIKDNCPGISDEIMEALFDPYSNDKELIKDSNKISGIGLAITQKILKLMDGDITIDSRKGEGTEYVINVPLKLYEAQTDAEASEQKELDYYDFFGKRILIVEDAPPSQMILGKFMKKVGFEIQIAINSQEALDKMKAAPTGYFDIIVIDEQPYDFSYYENISKIRGLKDNVKAKIPVILIKSNVSDKENAEAYSAGISEVLYKPLDIRVVMDALNRFLK